MELIKLGEESKSIKVHSYPSTSVQMGVAAETRWEGGPGSDPRRCTEWGFHWTSLEWTAGGRMVHPKSGDDLFRSDAEDPASPGKGDEKKN